MAALDQARGVVLAQVDVDGKTNEIPMFSVLLDQITTLTDVVVTADAMHAQRDHARYLHSRGAHYLITVKGNQPTLRRQLASLPWKDIPVGHSDTHRGHGRIEKRSIRATEVAAGLTFPHAGQAVQITRRTRSIKTRSKWRTETVYAICSLPAPWPNPTNSLPGSADIGRSRTACTGSATSPSEKTYPKHVPAPDPASWPPSATLPSASYAWPDTQQ
jgi:predicted transposase YbfD/YdcC